MNLNCTLYMKTYFEKNDCLVTTFVNINGYFLLRGNDKRYKIYCLK